VCVYVCVCMCVVCVSVRMCLCVYECVRVRRCLRSTSYRAGSTYALPGRDLVKAALAFEERLLLPRICKGAQRVRCADVRSIARSRRDD
jgi:hypothetical protein